MGLLSLRLLPLSTSILIASGSVLLYFIVLSIYRLTLHPLAKYPGPIRYKLSDWPLFWQAYKGNRHIWHLKDHEKYGPIVRIAPNTLSFNTDTALSTIYGPRTANVKKGEWYKTFDIAAGAYSSFTETDKDKHAVKRRWVTPIFAPESLKANEPVIIDTITKFCDTIKPPSNGWGTKRNGSVDATYLGFDIMGSLVFGHGFRSVQEEENRDLADSVLPASMFLYWISYIPLVTLVRPLLRTKLFEIVGGKPVADNNRLIDYGMSQVRIRSSPQDENEEEKELGGKHFLKRLVGYQDKRTGWHPTFPDLDTECLNLMMAGADPYSSVLGGLFFYLAHNEHALQKATAEVRSTFGSTDEIINGSQLNSCAYLYACIEETLRRATPVPSLLPRIVLPGGMSVDGHQLQAGTVIGVPAYALHHDSKYFPDPWSFRPERWIESESVTKESIDRARRAFTPFSIGTRQCSGKSLGYLQLKLTMAHILYRYDMRLAPDEPGLGGGGPDLEEGREREDEFQMWDALGFGRDGPMLEFKIASMST
ncbi:benzoate 4-monooxygenase cytochrome P450 [Amniculicola lignicola CBS 123094]|uniref:Benzoate 4-monooxygenase cytochrome P450 n=1 Tax=Amniculicola lignicola CBS 123094 TaxID=1392246 RepID=A0A6A5WWY6_9PLEO|nr:benzoate 4-monooxygenase cytochrome P450 [Amniculicola lignicola CBS 123094]